MIINKELLDKVSDEAKQSERLRMNYNFHETLDSKVQRLLNALEPGTTMPIHRHQQTAETYILLRGKIKVTFHNQDKSISSEYTLDPSQENYGVHIPANQWHSLEVLEHNSVIFEVKEGPYTPLTDKDILT
jgi:cupin fold WbuC family metalloprotein